MNRNWTYLLICLLFVACKNNGDTASGDTVAERADSLPPESAAIRQQLDYEISLPCADCEQQEITLSLFDDNGFERKTFFAGKPEVEGANPYWERGSWEMSGDTLLLEGLRTGQERYLKKEKELVDLASGHSLKEKP